MRQMVNLIVCQFCGRIARQGTDHWLDEPHRLDPSVHIVRCPEHWSEWALRNTSKGRTKEMRERMRTALAQPHNLFPPELDPFPTTDAPS